MEQKKHFDRRRNARSKVIKVGDQVLTVLDKTSTNPPFCPDPPVVTGLSLLGGMGTLPPSAENVASPSPVNENPPTQVPPYILLSLPSFMKSPPKSPYFFIMATASGNFSKNHHIFSIFLPAARLIHNYFSNNTLYITIIWT